MTKHDNGGSAFPQNDAAVNRINNHDGMTLWDYFAAHALPMLRRGDANFPKDYASYIAEIADAMIAERKKRMEEPLK